jgi:Protein of unknown function (DUF3159)
MRRELVRTLLINAIGPYVVYLVCKPYTGSLVALALSAVPPTVESLWSVVQRRRLDIVSALVLGGIVLSLVLVALGGSERVLLLRESLVTSLIGLVLAASVVLARPLLFYLFRQLRAGSDAAAVARWDERWEREPALRRTMRILTLVWGLGLVVEMAVRTAMVFDMEIADFLLISPFVQYGLTGLLAAWTVWFMRGRRL